MVKILLDTMALIDILTDRRFKRLASFIDQEKIQAVISTISLTEIFKVVGSKDEIKAKALIDWIVASRLEKRSVDVSVAKKAGELKLHYNLPTADALIAATGIVSGATHVVTEDVHFQSVKSLIKPIGLKQAERMV